MAYILGAPKAQFFATATSNGQTQFLSGGTLSTFAGGTTTPLAAYATYADAVANTNPIYVFTLDSRGETIIFLGESAYKLVLKDASGNQVYTVDNVTRTTAAVNFFDPQGYPVFTFSGTQIGFGALDTTEIDIGQNTTVTTITQAITTGTMTYNGSAGTYQQTSSVPFTISSTGLMTLHGTTSVAVTADAGTLTFTSSGNQRNTIGSSTLTYSGSGANASWGCTTGSLALTCSSGAITLTSGSAGYTLNNAGATGATLTLKGASASTTFAITGGTANYTLTANSALPTTANVLNGVTFSTTGAIGYCPSIIAMVAYSFNTNASSQTTSITVLSRFNVTVTTPATGSTNIQQALAFTPPTNAGAFAYIAGFSSTALPIAAIGGGNTLFLGWSSIVGLSGVVGTVIVIA